MQQSENLPFLNKCVTVRDKDTMAAGKDVKVLGCEDSYIYLSNPVDCLLISNCVNCTVFVAAVARSCTMDKCENVTLCCAANYLRIGNCIDCTVFSYSHQCAPVIYGDTRSLTLAPHNASYPELPELLRQAGINWKGLSKREEVADKMTPDQLARLEERKSHFARPILLHVPRIAI